MKKCSECEYAYYNEDERAWMCKDMGSDIEDINDYPDYTSQYCNFITNEEAEICEKSRRI